jgi:hypothetical protein
MRKFYFLFLSCSLILFAQSSKNTVQNWIDFNGSYTFNEQWKIFGDTGHRIIFGDNTYNRIYVRPAVAFQLNNVFSLHSGMSLFLTFDEGETLREFRPFQGLLINWPKFPSVPITQYLRFEERFFNGNQSSTLIYRGRYQLGTRIRLNEDKTEKYFYIPFQLEWFVDWNDNFNFRANEFRAVIGGGYVFDAYWRFEFNTIFQNLDASLDKIYSFHDVIFRFRLYKEFNTNL